MNTPKTPKPIPDKVQLSPKHSSTINKILGDECRRVQGIDNDIESLRGEEKDDEVNPAVVVLLEQRVIHQYIAWITAGAAIESIINYLCAVWKIKGKYTNEEFDRIHRMPTAEKFLMAPKYFVNVRINPEDEWYKDLVIIIKIRNDCMHDVPHATGLYAGELKSVKMYNHSDIPLVVKERYSGLNLLKKFTEIYSTIIRIAELEATEPTSLQ